MDAVACIGSCVVVRSRRDDAGSILHCKQRSTCEYSGARSCSYDKVAESEAFGVKRKGPGGTRRACDALQTPPDVARHGGVALQKGGSRGSFRDMAVALGRYGS